MSNMITKKEQEEILRWEEAQRDPGMTTSQKIDLKLSEYEKQRIREEAQREERILKENVLPVVQRLDDHDKKIKEHDGFFDRIKRNFLGIAKG
jgi:hypothetical protein